MKRFLFMSQLKSGKIPRFKAYLNNHAEELRIWLTHHGLITCSLFACGRLLFLYVESPREEHDFIWPQPYLKWLERWPGEHEPRVCVPMLDIFHDGRPITLESWRGERNVEQRIGSLARLMPEMYSSYVFYHYQLQEERPGSFNKTYIIGGYENYIFSYCEAPPIVDESCSTGLLKTNNTPENWHETMFPHFQQWADVSAEERVWRIMETIFSY